MDSGIESESAQHGEQEVKLKGVLSVGIGNLESTFDCKPEIIVELLQEDTVLAVNHVSVCDSI